MGLVVPVKPKIGRICKGPDAGKTDMDAPNGNEMLVFYDGECPFCSAYVRLLRLREAVGRVELIDARSDDVRVGALKDAGVDLNAGMAVRYGGTLYHGADAMRILSVLSADGGILRAVMKSPRRAKVVYPFLRAGRGLVLRLLGRKPIR